MYNDLNSKFEALSTHVKKLDIKVAQTVEAIKRQAGVLPVQLEYNPKEYCNAIIIELRKESMPLHESLILQKTQYSYEVDEPIYR